MRCIILQRLNPFLTTAISYLKGVGPSRAEVLQKEFDIFTFNDLLYYFPYRHIDRSKIYKIADVDMDLPYIQLKGRISHFRTQGAGKAARLTAILNDGTGELELVWFQGAKWVKESISSDKEYLVFGKPTEFKRVYNMVHPTIDDTHDAEGKLYLHIQPFYNVSEKAKKAGCGQQGHHEACKYFAQ